MAILDPGLPAKHQFTAIEGVVDHAVAATRIAIDGGGVPLAAARADNASGVQVAYDGAWRYPGGISAEDFSNDFGFCWIDVPQSTYWFSSRIQFAAYAIAVDAAACVSTGACDALEAAPLQPVGGMDIIAKRLGEKLGGVVRLNPEVTRLSRRGSGAEITWKDRLTGRSQILAADFCVCTIPLPVLKGIPNDFSADRNAIFREAKYGNGFKIAYQTPRFWEADANIYGGLSFTDRDTFMTWYPSGGYHRPKGVLIAGYAFGDQARRMAARSLAEQDDYARETIERLHPGRAHLMEAPISIHWAEMPFSQGVTSDVARINPTGYGLLCEPDGPYVLAGEHTAQTGAWMQGAFLAGWRAVGQVAEMNRARAA